MLELSLRGLQDQLSHNCPACSDLPAERAVPATCRLPPTSGPCSCRSFCLQCSQPCFYLMKTSLLRNPAQEPAMPRSCPGPLAGHVLTLRSLFSHSRAARDSPSQTAAPVGVSYLPSALGLPGA